MGAHSFATAMPHDALGRLGVDRTGASMSIHMANASQELAHVEFEQCLDRQRAAYLAHPEPSYAERSCGPEDARTHAEGSPRAPGAGHLRRLRQPLRIRDAIRRVLCRARYDQRQHQEPQEVDEAAAPARRSAALPRRVQPCHSAAARRRRGDRAVEFSAEPVDAVRSRPSSRPATGPW